MIAEFLFLCVIGLMFARDVKRGRRAVDEQRRRVNSLPSADEHDYYLPRRSAAKHAA